LIPVACFLPGLIRTAVYDMGETIIILENNEKYEKKNLIAVQTWSIKTQMENNSKVDVRGYGFRK
jgi:hypothetical protein